MHRKSIKTKSKNKTYEQKYLQGFKKNALTKYYEKRLQNYHCVCSVLVIFCRTWGMPLSVLCGPS